MRTHRLNEKGITLVELLAAIFLLAVIVGPLLMFSVNMLDNTLRTGDRIQVVNVARGVLDDARSYARSGDEVYDVGSYPLDLSDYEVDVEISKYSVDGELPNPNLKEITVTVGKKNSRLKAVELKTMVWVQ